jgi:hypothetical protein
MLTLIFPVVILLNGCEGGDSAEETQVQFQPRTQIVTQNEVVHYEISNDANEVIGRGVLSTLLSADGVLTLVEEYYKVGETEATDTIETQVRRADLTPVRGERVVKQNSEANIDSLNYSWSIQEFEDKEELLRSYFVRSDKAGQDERVALARQETVYANSSGIWLWRALPLDIGFKTNYMTVDSLNLKQQRVVVTVPQEESLVIGSKTYEVWRVLIRSGRATRSAWIEKAAPNRVLRWDNGVTVMTVLE